MSPFLCTKTVPVPAIEPRLCTATNWQLKNKVFQFGNFPNKSYHFKNTNNSIDNNDNNNVRHKLKGVLYY
jgi:hypothetical protein